MPKPCLVSPAAITRAHELQSVHEANGMNFDNTLGLLDVDSDDEADGRSPKGFVFGCLEELLESLEWEAGV